MSVIKFNRNFSDLFNWDTSEQPTTEQEYQNAVKNWTQTEMNLVDTVLWQPETAYSVGNIAKTPSLPSQYILVCTEAGDSGVAEPDYTGVSVGDTVVDGTATWLVSTIANSDNIDALTTAVEANTQAIGEHSTAIAENTANVATNTADIATNAENIATNTADIANNTTDIEVADKRISNIEKLLQGNLYDYQTDSTEAYTKTVPAGAMPYAGIEKLGGKTVVWNQLVDSGTTTVATISGHKYYTLISGTASIVTSNGSAITIVDDTADMVTDLTLCFGSGNEPTTVQEFQQMFPASYYSYNAGTLLSAGVTSVVSKKADTTTLATYSIPAEVRALSGYGWSCPSHYNYIDFEAKKFVQEVGSRAYASGDESDSTVVTDKTTTYYPLNPAVETDISAYLTDNLIEVEAGGTLTFPNSNGDDYRIPVPSTEEYMINLQEAVSNG